MTLEGFFIWLVIGAIAGWLAGQVVKGYGFGLVGNIVVGVLGAVVGGWVFSALGIDALIGLSGDIIGATIGAILLLVLIKFMRRIA
jgi:uncharacterized membrane protein YeaQ/YmgE (transglycosylase-associated protein family)